MLENNRGICDKYLILYSNADYIFELVNVCEY